jgi:hypothetical protein
VALDGRFIKLLEMAMKESNKDRTNLLWRNITPSGIDIEHIKRLAIRDIIVEYKPKKTETIGMDTPQTKIPIILGIENPLIKVVGTPIDKLLYSSGTEKDKQANLCGYLLNFVFSKTREGEVYKLLAMYIAVSINDGCFIDYILEGTQCNPAFNNIANLLHLDNYTTGTVEANICIEALTKSLLTTYGDKYVDLFTSIVKDTNNETETMGSLDAALTLAADAKRKDDAAVKELKQKEEEEKALAVAAATEAASAAETKRNEEVAEAAATEATEAAAAEAAEAAEAKQKEDELKQKEEELKQKEEELKQKEEELKQKEEEAAAAKLKKLQEKFNEITYNYKTDVENILNNADKLERYINVIEILKNINDYKLNAKYMKESINAYINNNQNGALKYISNPKVSHLNNDFIKGVNK